ncbi:hypothetical protein, partial [Brucella lupini]
RWNRTYGGVGGGPKMPSYPILDRIAGVEDHHRTRLTSRFHAADRFQGIMIGALRLIRGRGFP